MGKLNWAVLKNPWVVLFGMVSGIITGVCWKSVALAVAPVGEAYLAFLSMCVIPIMMTAIITSFGRLIASKEASEFLKKILLVFLVGLLLVSIVGLMVSLVGNPGKGLDQERLNILGKVLVDLEGNNSVTQDTQSFSNFSEFLKVLIPANIFKALYDGRNLQILFFSIILGLTVGILPAARSKGLLDITESIFKAFEKAIAMAMLFLPLGLFCMLAGQIARTGIDIMIAMTKFVVLMHLAALLLILLSAALIAFTSRRNYYSTFLALRQPIIIAFGTRNSFATMPAVFDALRDHFKVEQNTIKLIVPLSIVLCRYSMVLTFTIGTIFIAQLYGLPLTISQLAFILLMTILAAVAGAGAPGVVALSMITMVLAPLGLPSGAAVILLLAINAIIDPILTVLNIHLTCSSTLLIDRLAKHN